MNRIHPRKLLHSKWTAVRPVHKEKHFMVTGVEFDDDGNVLSCTIEAVHSKRESDIEWRDLKDTDRWRQGWT